MGQYINPGNAGFAEIDDEDYVDKTMLIDFINQTVEKKNKLTCVTRPRRFGKSFAAKMLAAYYDCSCDSRALFFDKKIASTKDYDIYLNYYNVIYLDITAFTSVVRATGLSFRDVPKMIAEELFKDLCENGFEPKDGDSVNDLLLRHVGKNNKKPFIFIIDEWDTVIREAKEDDIAQEAYFQLLRGWFNNAKFTPKVVAAAL